MSSNDEFIVVGKLGKTRGVRGELYITLLTDFPDRFLDLKDIHVMERGGWTSRHLRSSELVGGRPVISFEGVNTKEEAARMTNLELGVKTTEVVPLPDGSYYVYDLVGCEVIDESTGERLGTVREVEKLPANDMYVVSKKDGGELLVPVVGQFVKDVDITRRRIVVDARSLTDEAAATTKK